MTSSAIMSKTDELLKVLDEDIQHLETTLSTLDTLRSLLIKHDDSSLNELLDDIRKHASAHATNERRRQELRTELAEVLACDAHKVTLSTLQASLPDDRRQAVADRQTKLKSLVQRLRREYSLTSQLVSDCARFNRSLVHAFFGLGNKRGLTYSPNGIATQMMDASLVSLQF